MSDNFKLALAQAGSFWGSWLFPHLGAIMLQEHHKGNNFIECENRTHPTRTTLLLELLILQGLLAALILNLPKRLAG
jgi:hypothetical protein